MNLAQSIAATQRTEMADMQAWLDAWAAAPLSAEEQRAADVARLRASASAHGHHHDDAVAVDDGSGTSDHVEHGPGSPVPAAMPGMLSGDQLRTLRTADADTAGHLFLELMIEHHLGAVAMSEDVLTSVQNPWVRNLARHVVRGQASEIGAMRRVLDA